MRKKPSGLRSTKVKVLVKGNSTYANESDSKDEDGNSKEDEVQPRKKHKDIFVADLIILESHGTHLYIHES